MICKNHRGFALPTILIASLIMLTILTVTLISADSTVTGIQSQEYNQMAQNASESGIDYASACLRENGGVVTWTDSKPLTPASDCSGNLPTGLTCNSDATDSRCFLSVNGDQKTSFSVSAPDDTSPGNKISIHSDGYLYIYRATSGTIWKKYNATTTRTANVSTGNTGIVSSGLVLNVDADNLDSYPTANGTWSDLSGYGNNCTLVKGTTPDITNGTTSIVFNGAGYAACPAAAVFNSKNITYSNWIYPTATSSSKEFTIMGKEIQYRYVILNGVLCIHISVNGTSWTTYDASTVSVPINTWSNVAITLSMSSTSASVTYYLNGNKADTFYTTFTSTTVAFNTNPTYIGDFYNDSSYGYFFIGKIGDAMMYNRVLSPDEVNQNFQALRGRYGK